MIVVNLHRGAGSSEGVGELLAAEITVDEKDHRSGRVCKGKRETNGLLNVGRCGPVVLGELLDRLTAREPIGDRGGGDANTGDGRAPERNAWVDHHSLGIRGDAAPPDEWGRRDATPFSSQSMRFK